MVRSAGAPRLLAKASLLAGLASATRPTPEADSIEVVPSFVQTELGSEIDETAEAAEASHSHGDDAALLQLHVRNTGNNLTSAGLMPMADSFLQEGQASRYEPGKKYLWCCEHKWSRHLGWCHAATCKSSDDMQVGEENIKYISSSTEVQYCSERCDWLWTGTPRDLLRNRNEPSGFNPEFGRVHAKNRAEEKKYFKNKPLTYFWRAPPDTVMVRKDIFGDFTKYRFQDFLGNGGVGVVWSYAPASDSNGPTIAVKQLSLERYHEDEEGSCSVLKRIVRGRPDHPGVPVMCRCLDIEPVADQWLVAEEECGDTALRDLMTSDDDFPGGLDQRNFARKILFDSMLLVNLLQTADDGPWCHLDIKSLNMRWRSQSKGLKIIDWGSLTPAGFQDVGLVKTRQWCPAEHIARTRPDYETPVTVYYDPYAVAVMYLQELTFYGIASSILQWVEKNKGPIEMSAIYQLNNESGKSNPGVMTDIDASLVSVMVTGHTRPVPKLASDLKHVTLCGTQWTEGWPATGKASFSCEDPENPSVQISLYDFSATLPVPPSCVRLLDGVGDQLSLYLASDKEFFEVVRHVSTVDGERAETFDIRGNEVTCQGLNPDKTVALEYSWDRAANSIHITKLPWAELPGPSYSVWTPWLLAAAATQGGFLWLVWWLWGKRAEKSQAMEV